MTSIITKEIKDVRYALGSYETAKNRFNQIKRTFPDGNEYRIFAEPIILSEGNKIAWTSEYEGIAINFSKLSPEEQGITQDKLTEQIKKLLNAAKQFEDLTLVEFLYKCIEIPNLNDIFIIRKENVDQVVLTQWGLISDTPGAEKGILEKIINTLKIPMVFDVVYLDGTIASGIEIYFEYDLKKEKYVSSIVGKITLEKVKIEAPVKAYQLEDNNPTNLHSFTCYEGGKYLIKVVQKIDMLFKVINSNKQPLPNEQFEFRYKDFETKLISDNNGEMILPKVVVDTEVTAIRIVDNNEELTTKFICRKDQKEYLIIIQLPVEPVVVPEPPQIHKMRIKVVDKKDNVIPNAEVSVTFGGKTIKLFSDEYGYVEVEGVKPGEPVKVVATAKKK